MGKYKQWLHHQEVGARLRDEIAAHEAERERVLKLAPTRTSPLPDLSNPIIAALLGQASVLKAPEPATAQNNGNGASRTASASATEVVVEARTGKERPATAEVKTAIASKTTEVNGQIAKEESQPAQEGAAPAKPVATSKAKAGAAPAKNNAEKQAAPHTTGQAPAAELPAQADTIDPLLEQLLAQAESAPDDPLEALNLLASQGPDLTRGDAPQSLSTISTAPLTPPGAAGQSALKTLLAESKTAPEPEKKLAADAGSAAVAVGVEVITTAEASARAEAPARGEKGRSDTDELVAARPTEGYTEPRLIVPQWLRSMELGEGQEGNQVGSAAEEADDKQRFSVSLPFENEEDMRLHESVERWWQRWRQQS